MTDTPKPLTPEETEAAISRLDQRLRNASGDPTSQAGRVWPNQYREAARCLFQLIPADASDDDFNAAVIEVAGQRESMFRPWSFNNGKDLKKMTASERLAYANELAAAAEAARKQAKK